MINEYHLSEKQAKEITFKYKHEYITEKVNLVKTKKHIDHPGAYLISALKKDYKEKAGKTAKIENRVVKNSYLREAKQASEILSLKNKYMSYKLKKYTNFIQQQAEDIQNAVKEKFEQLLRPNTEIFQLYNKSGVKSPFVMADFIGFIDKHSSHIIGDYMSFDDNISSENVDEVAAT